MLALRSSDQDQNEEGRVPPIIRGALGTNITLHENVEVFVFHEQIFQVRKIKGKGSKIQLKL